MANVGFGDRTVTVNDIICECNKLAQKEYKSRHEWVGKAAHSQLCKTLKFDHAD